MGCFAPLPQKDYRINTCHNPIYFIIRSMAFPSTQSLHLFSVPFCFSLYPSPVKTFFFFVFSFEKKLKHQGSEEQENKNMSGFYNQKKLFDRILYLKRSFFCLLNRSLCILVAFIVISSSVFFFPDLIHSNSSAFEK